MKIFCLTLFISIWGLCIASCSQAQNKPETSVKAFRLPDVPAVLTAPEDRAAYLAQHYWDHFDFADTSLIALPEITEQAFVDFISILPYTEEAGSAVDTLFHRASVDEAMLHHFVSLGDKYLYEPNSPLHNEELYILVLRALIANPAMEEADKLRPRHRLEMALKNRPGDVAADFVLTCRNGRLRRLSALDFPYLLLYFNDPECEDCRRVKEQLVASPVLSGLVESGRLGVVSVCVEGKTSAWEQATFPSQWIEGYDAGQQLTRNRVYDLKALPTLYLLDNGKRVLLKDATVEAIEKLMADR